MIHAIKYDTIQGIVNSLKLFINLIDNCEKSCDKIKYFDIMIRTVLNNTHCLKYNNFALKHIILRKIDNLSYKFHMCIYYKDEIQKIY